MKKLLFILLFPVCAYAQTPNYFLRFNTQIDRIKLVKNIVLSSGDSVIVQDGNGWFAKIATADLFNSQGATHWNMAYSWGNHAAAGYYLASNPAGYISGFTETDPIWSAVSNTYRTKIQNDLLYRSIAYVPDWTDILNKPLTFAPSAHTHPISEVINLQTILNGKEPSITGTTSADYYRGDKMFVPLNKTAVGLENVDNTTDLGKPISTAMQTALNGKENSVIAGITTQYYRGDKTFQALNTLAVPELTNLYFTNARAQAAISAGLGIGYAAGVLTNTAPDQVVTITGANGLTITGTYPNFTVSRKRQETYSGVTNASGIYSVTFGTAYSVAPNIQTNLIGGSNKMTWIVTISTTGFSIFVQTRADVLGLLPSYSNTVGQAIDVLITEK